MAKVVRKKRVSVSAAESLFAGSGDMRALCRTHDWSATPLGPVEGWSTALRSCVQMVMAAGTPMLVFWGPELVQIFNDPFRPSLGEGDAHLRALGIPAAEYWAEIWEHRGPQIARILDGGDAGQHADVHIPMTRNGRLEDVWWTYGDSAVFGDDGAIAGVLVACQETTARVLAEQQQAVLLETIDGERARLKAVFRQAPAFMALLNGPQHVFEFANDAYYQLVGNRELIGKPLWEAVPEARNQGFEELLEAVLATGTPYVGKALPVRLIRVPGTDAVERFIDLTYTAMLSANGVPEAIIAHGVDVTDQVQARREVERLLRESERSRALVEESERRFRETANAAPVLIWTAGLDSHCDWFNASWLAFTGRTMDEEMGDGWMTGVHDEDLAHSTERYSQSFAARQSFTLEYRLRRHDGAYRWLLDNGVPRFADDGTFVGYIGTCLDITEQYTVRDLAVQAEAQLRTLADTMPTLAWTARPDGHVDWYNARWYEYTGAKAADMEGWGWQAVHDPEVLPAVIEKWGHSVATGEPFEMTFPLRGADGIFQAFLMRGMPSRNVDGAVVRWFGTATNIESEQRLRRAAEEANRAKSEFLAVMSHELRTPLNAIDGYAELMELGIRGPVTEEQRQDLARIRKSEKHLLGLINGVLNYAQVEAGAVRYELEDVPVEEVLSTCEALISPQVRTKGLVLRRQPSDPSLTVQADREKLQQVVLNLLSNAVKFTEPGGRIELRWVLTRGPRGSVVHIKVADTGIGIAASQLARVFEPFVQVDSQLTRTREGTGLGLAISRDLARGMGGDLSAESALGSGSTFTLTMRVA